MKNSKPFKLILIVVLLVIGGIVGWYVYQNYKEKNENPVSGLKPKIEMGIGRISNITDSTIDLSLNLLVHNPLPIGFDLKGFDYSVEMNGVKILENITANPCY